MFDWLLRIVNWISQIIYVIQDLPADHLPDSQKFSRLLGVALHLTHFVVTYFRIRNLKDQDIGWQDMLGEISIHEELESDSWIDWVCIWNQPVLYVSVKMIVLTIFPDNFCSGDFTGDINSKRYISIYAQ